MAMKNHYFPNPSFPRKFPAYFLDMEKIILFLVLVVPGYLGATDIWNVSARQQEGTSLVLITYDLVDPEQVPNEIIMEVSQDGGTHYTIHPQPEGLTGDVGKGVIPGQNKSIYWDVSMDFKKISGHQFRVKLTAHK